MSNNTENLIHKINILINSLEKTSNQTVKFFRGVIERIESCKTDEELKKTLDGLLIHSAAITDYGGFNREQCNLFDEVWKVAKSICTQ